MMCFFHLKISSSIFQSLKNKPIHNGQKIKKCIERKYLSDDFVHSVFIYMKTKMLKFSSIYQQIINMYAYTDISTVETYGTKFPLQLSTNEYRSLQKFQLNQTKHWLKINAKVTGQLFEHMMFALQNDNF